MYVYGFTGWQFYQRTGLDLGTSKNLSGRVAGTGNPGGMEINGINFVTTVAVEIQLGVVTFGGSTSGD